MESLRNTREDGLTQLGQAYIDVKAGTASVVLITVRGDDLTVQTANIAPAEALIAVAQANKIMATEICGAMHELVDIVEDLDREPDDNDARGNA